MVKLRDLFSLTRSSILIGIYSGLGLLVILLTHGIYNEYYAAILGDKVGVGIIQTSFIGIISGALVFVLVFMSTNFGINLRYHIKTTEPGKAGLVTGLLIVSIFLVVGIMALYVTPFAFNIIPLAELFIVSGVVSISTFIVLYNWKLSDIHDQDLKLKDLEFAHEDTHQIVNLVTWGSIIFLIGAVVGGMGSFDDNFALGTVESIAWGNVKMLSLFKIMYVAIGIWFGWVAPHLGKLEEIRLELRKLDQKLLKKNN